MSHILIENILNKNFVVAEEQFRDRLNTIKEHKLLEMKKDIASQMDEAFGGLTQAEIAARKAAGYRKAADVLGDPWSQRKKGQFLGAKVKVKRKKKEAVKEAMEVQPDPEGRVRGGKAAKGTLARNIAAKAIRTVRKGSRAAGDIGAEVVSRVGAAKHSWDKYKQEKAKAAAATTSDADYAKAAGAEPSHPKDVSTEYKRPGRLQRNVNTLMGREPGHVDTRTPEEKLKTKGGRLGKIIRAGLKGAESGLSSSGIS